MKNTYLIYLIALMLVSISCKQKQDEQQGTTETSKSKKATVKLVAQQRPDGEPIAFEMPIDKGLDKLEFAHPDTVEIDDTDLVIGVTLGTEQIAVPLTYMEGFEVANLSMEANNYVITWCPLVGSARIFDGVLEGDTSGFNFGRGLKENNLLLVDRKTQTVWNQLSNTAIHGELKGERLAPLPTIQSTWNFWKKKYPDTKLLINRDTTDAVFPSVLFENPHYNTWEPGKGRYETTDQHQTENVGLGIELGDSAVYFPFENLFKEKSPIPYKIGEQLLSIHFDKDGLTAWAEKSDGTMVPSTVVYNWAWKNFYPDSAIFEN